MADIIPNLTNEQLDELSRDHSNAEVKIYRALRDNLPKAYVVLFQVPLKNKHARDVEADFLVCHPKHGYVCIEVKGGGIRFDSNRRKWFSIDHEKDEHEIKDPYEQVKRVTYSIRDKLENQKNWPKGVTFGHAVFFPDISEKRAPSRPEMPQELIGCWENLENPEPWIHNVFLYWKGMNNAPSIPLGNAGINIILKVFAESFTAPPLVSSSLEEQESRRLVLTDNQIRLLDFLKNKNNSK